jgi:hypothetical protein
MSVYFNIVLGSSIGEGPGVAAEPELEETSWSCLFSTAKRRQPSGDFVTPLRTQVSPTRSQG